MTSSAAPRDASAISRAQLDRIHPQLVELEYRHGRPGFAITLVVAILLSAFVSQVLPYRIAFGWLGAMTMIAAIRFVATRRFFADPRRDARSKVWALRFNVGVAATGLGWGVAGTLFYAIDSLPHQAMVVFALAGMTGGAVAYLSFTRGVFPLYAVFTLGPFIATNFVRGGTLYTTTGVLVLVFFTGLMVSSRRMHLAFVESLMLRSENVDLLEAVRRSQRALSMHVAQTPVAVIQWQEGFVVSEWNSAAERIFGWTRDEALGKTANQLIEGANVDRMDALWRQIVNEKGSVLSTTEQMRKDGARVVCDWFHTALVEPDGRLLGVASMAHDVTEREVVDRMKREFVSTVSHELRTPLTAIRGALALIAEGAAGPIGVDGKELVDIAEANSIRLSRLIDDLLDFDRLATGSVAFETRLVEVDALVIEAIKASRHYALQYDVMLVRRDIDSTLRVDTDPDRLSQVLLNLLSNAAKFSRRGGTVEISATKRDGRAVLAVRDYGIGIAESFRPRVFQKFSQADASDVRQKGGTGLGLSITKAIVDRLGGEIWFDSVEGSGTTFFVALPGATG